MATTLKEIAQECGVSVQAVSLALNNRGNISSATRERILQVAQTRGYRRSSVAHMMRTGRFGSVALLQSTHHGWFAEALLRSIHDELARNDLHLSIVRLPDEQLVDEQELPRLLREWACDGLLISYIIDIPPRLLDLVERHHIPAIWLNVQREDDCVYLDDFGAARFATNLLIEKGHERIDYLDDVQRHESRHYSARARWQGYESAMLAAHLMPRAVEFTSRTPYTDARDIARDWLTQPAPPTAVLSYNDGGVLVMQTAALQMGLRVPEDLSLISFAGPTVPAFLGTSDMGMPWPEMGVQAVQMLLQKIENPQRVLPARIIEAFFFAGNSIAPPSQNRSPR